jgi:hypothetical protein
MGIQRVPWEIGTGFLCSINLMFSFELRTSKINKHVENEKGHRKKRRINKPDEKTTSCTFRPVNIRDVMKVDARMMK